MVELTISKENNSHQILKEQLEKLVFARKVNEVENIKEPSIRYGDDSRTGFKDVSDYISSLEPLVESWNQCLCDNWDNIV